MHHSVICPHCQSPVVDASGLLAGPIVCPECAETIHPAMVVDQNPVWVASKFKTYKGRTTTTQRPAANASEPETNDVQAVMDVVTGVNLRWKDNLIQAAVIAATTIVGVPVGWLISLYMQGDPVLGLILGGFGGLLLGLFGSGFVIAIYRLKRR